MKVLPIQSSGHPSATVTALDGTESRDYLVVLAKRLDVKPTDNNGPLGPELLAAIQAMYSRDPGLVAEKLDEVLGLTSGEDKSAKRIRSILEIYYLKYGHGSIGDLGQVTVFIDQASMLAAVAFLHDPLVNCQEASSRYIDLGEQTILTATDAAPSTEILQRWMDFYAQSMEPLKAHLRTLYPLSDYPSTTEKLYEKALFGRACDILRGFLPAGTTTGFCMTLHLRAWRRHLTRLRVHPLAEVRALAEEVQAQLLGRYPHSFRSIEDSAPSEYQQQYGWAEAQGEGEFSMSGDLRLDPLTLKMIQSRPAKAYLPEAVGTRAGELRVQGLLDFGGWRDLHRQRTCMTLPMTLTMEYGFEEWYLSEMPEGMQSEATGLLAEQKEAIEGLGGTATEKQYLIPMGYRARMEFVGKLPHMVYFMELREKTTVHPTVRFFTHKMIQWMGEQYPEVKIYAELTPHGFFPARGKAA